MLFVAPEFLDEEWGCHDNVAFYIIVRMELFSEGEDPLLKGVKSELEKSSFVVVRVGCIKSDVHFLTNVNFLSP